MLEYFLKALGILFIAIGPVDNAIVYAGLGHNYTKKKLREMALRACLVGTVVILAFALGGNYILQLIDVKLHSLQVGGGILLLLLSIKIVMDEYKTGEDVPEDQKQRDLSIFPLAMPLIAGPAAITLSTELLARASGDMAKQSMVVVAITLLMLLSYVLLVLAGGLTKLLGDKGGEVLSRILGILLAVISADLIINGLQASGLFGH